jgi:hypothetical protein
LPCGVRSCRFRPHRADARSYPGPWERTRLSRCDSGTSAASSYSLRHPKGARLPRPPIYVRVASGP